MPYIPLTYLSYVSRMYLDACLMYDTCTIILNESAALSTVAVTVRKKMGPPDSGTALRLYKQKNSV